MPRGNNMSNGAWPTLKILIGGQPKAGKSDWVLRALEAGFNVLFLDGDVASATIEGCEPKLSQEALARLYYLDIRDRMTGGVDPVMIDFCLTFFRETSVVWNDTQQALFTAKSLADTDDVWVIKPGRLDHTVLLVIDSWSALAFSAVQKKADQMGVVVEDVEKIERGLYAGAGNALTVIAKCIKSARCHVAVTFHPDEFQKFKMTKGMTQKTQKEDERVLEWSKMIPKSSSRPHGYTLAQDFTDILWIDIDRTGKRIIDGEVTDQRVSGGHFKKGDPRKDYRFVDLVRMTGGYLPNGNEPTDSWLTIYGPGEYAAQALTRKPNPILGQAKAPAAAPVDTAATDDSKGVPETAPIQKINFAALSKMQTKKVNP